MAYLIIGILSAAVIIAAVALYGKVLFDMFSPFFPEETSK